MRFIHLFFLNHSAELHLHYSASISEVFYFGLSILAFGLATQNTGQYQLHIYFNCEDGMVEKEH